MKNKLRIIISIILALVFFVLAQNDVIAQSKPKSKFYDFGAQIIDGEIKKPTALYTDTKKE